MPAVTVKWGKEKLEIDADLSESPLVFKSQLFAMTGVAPDRQKIMIKGKTLGDEGWTGITMAEGATIMMMGSASAVPEAPKVEVSTNGAHNEEQKRIVKMPRGLNNLGNTCYMNSVLQSFKTIPELRAALSKIQAKQVPGISGQIAKGMHSLFNDLSQPSSGSEDAFTPLLMLQLLHKAMPQFAERGPHGLEQQDANECFTELQRLCLTGLQGASEGVDKYFKGSFAVTQKCTESDDEPVQTTSEDFYQLSCFLSTEVKYIQTGIKEKLTEEIVKNSMKLNRDAKWQKKALISRLPAYLSVQMVRFFYKESSKTNAKVLKDVKFPMMLDLCDICTPALQEKMRPHRDAVKLEEDAKLDRMRLKKMEGKTVNKDEDDDKDDGVPLPVSFEDDEGSNNSGFYQLQAVITHKGRASNSGHYVAWVRLEGNKWAMCDDDEVHPVLPEEVLKLSGGGDWHTAYVLLYGPRVVKKYPELKPEATVTEEPMQTN